MKTQELTKKYMLGVIAIGFLCLVAAMVSLPLEKVDLRFLFLAAFTVGFGWRGFTVQIPKFKSHISVSDTFIFFALLYFGGDKHAVLDLDADGEVDVVAFDYDQDGAVDEVYERSPAT